MASKVITGTIEGIRSLQDRSIKITIETQELNGADVGELFAFQNKFCKILITDDRVLNPDMAKAVEETEIEHWEKKKSQGARLRGVLYILFMQDHEGHSSFEEYYKAKTNNIIEHFKTKIVK